MKIDISKWTRRGTLAWKKHGPEILVLLGVGGVIGGGVMACRATLKLSGVMEDHAARTDALREAREEDETAEARKELALAYLTTGTALARLYAPAATVSLLSIASILAGNSMLRRRGAALAAAYLTLEKSFRDYRGRVRERFGEETENELRHGLRREKMEETIVTEDGKKKKVKREIMLGAENGPSDFARYFAYGEAKGAEANEDYNRFFLRAQEEMANHMLRARGVLFLNEVYDMLGIDRSIAGQAVGWVYDRDSEDGDNYVDFGVQEVYRKKSDAPGDYEKVFLLDFNVDGAILGHSVDKGLLTA